MSSTRRNPRRPMSSTRRNPRQLLNRVSINLGCSCRIPKISSIFNPKPKSKLPEHRYHNHLHHHNPLSHYSSSYTATTSSSTQTTTTSSFSPFIDYHDPYFSYNRFGRQEGLNTVAFEKESDDPYLDFRDSMLQMIVENEIYSKKELKELLNCFIDLNDPCLHGIIIRVFTEIWNDFFFSAGGASNGRRTHRGRNARQRGYVLPKSYEV